LIDLQQTDMTPAEDEEQTRLLNERRMEQVQAFGMRIAKKRDEAVEGRTSSGVEDTWVQCEEFYEGIDDANRGETGSSLKPSTSGSSSVNKKKESRSTVFLNITRPYCDAASAKVADMLLPTDDRNWGIKPTPVPLLVSALKDETPIPAELAGAASQAGVTPQGAPAMPTPQGSTPDVSALQGGAQAMLDQQQPPAAPGQPPAKPPAPPTVADLARKAVAMATEKAEIAEKQIEDWHSECQYNAEVRKVIEDCAKLGTGILKGPFPMRKTRRAMRMENGVATLEMESVIIPVSKRIDPWNFYPDPACGDSIHNGQYCFEKDLITARQLNDLKGTDYLDDQIDEVLEEGPGKRNVNSMRLNQASVNDKEKFEIWYGSIFVTAEELEAANIESDNEEGAYALVTLVNDRVIKVAMQPLDGGEFCYDVMPWQRRPNLPYGIGVAEQVRTPQRIVNAGSRNMMDNAGVSAGGQIVIRRGAVEPADGSWNITPRKIWYVKDDADIRSVNDAFAMVTLASAQQELMNIIQFAMKMAEDVTGLPMLLQGQQGKAPDTLGGMQLLQNNASSVLRRLARTFDDCITAPHIRRYYQWLLEYGENDEAKGDFMVDARGSTALVERDLGNQAIIQMGALVANPMYGLDPALWSEEMLRAQKLDPKRFVLSDEKKAEAAKNAQPPIMPQIEVAKIRAEIDTKRLELEKEVAAQREATAQTKIKVDTDRDTVYVQAEQARNESEAAMRMRELEVKREIEMLRYATQQKVTLEQIRADLADSAAKINLQRELAGVAHAVDMRKHNSSQVMKPPVEPPGRADPGEAYQE
jgi:hypothetical protein